ncbi:hypothetical protein PIB30_065092 [Stylosanthes scabra]|uniref:CHY-type domain-containing protein n=1 Tax=Stylosanthes scabra TaxID=79078 RepID=A0ABU6UKY9_9FABA|nr:hypothetical protein [Stylosanthes scabra]
MQIEVVAIGKIRKCSSFSSYLKWLPSLTKTLKISEVCVSSASITGGDARLAPCCDEVFDCRHCHNDAKNSEEVNVNDHHDIPRHEINKVQQYCIKCGVCMGKYFCGTCKFFDDDVSKNQYHCDDCGICK